MKTLINSLTKKIILPLAFAGAFSFNSYAQRTEKIENGFINQYDEKHQLIRRVNEEGGKKTISDYKYNKKGKMIEVIDKEDNENDGKFDYLDQSNYKYDENGNEIEMIYKEDNENDGKFDYLEQKNYKYDGGENMIEVIYKKDNENDGKFDFLVQENYEHNKKGNMIEIIYKQDNENDGKFDYYKAKQL